MWFIVLMLLSFPCINSFSLICLIFLLLPFPVLIEVRTVLFSYFYFSFLSVIQFIPLFRNPNASSHLLSMRVLKWLVIFRISNPVSTTGFCLTIPSLQLTIKYESHFNMDFNYFLIFLNFHKFSLFLNVAILFFHFYLPISKFFLYLLIL